MRKACLPDTARVSPGKGRPLFCGTDSAKQGVAQLSRNAVTKGIAAFMGRERRGSEDLVK